jgi:hypothetical protein
VDKAAYKFYTNVFHPKFIFSHFDMYMSLVPLISYDLGTLESRILPYVTSQRGHSPLLIRIYCITWRISKLLETLSFIRVT